jgi:hypothetical protein
MCFGLRGDLNEKKGQVAHLDRDPSNNEPRNLAYLCQEHHDDYDTKRSQTAGYLDDEVRQHRDELLRVLEEWPLLDAGDIGHTGGSRKAVSLELFDRRIAIYRIVRTYLLGIVGAEEVDLEMIRKFAQDTEEALFLFDGKVASYLDDLYRRGVELRAVSQRQRFLRERPEAFDELAALNNKDAELLQWFTRQFAEARKLFKGYLHL